MTDRRLDKNRRQERLPLLQVIEERPPESVIYTRAQNRGIGGRLAALGLGQERLQGSSACRVKGKAPRSCRPWPWVSSAGTASGGGLHIPGRDCTRLHEISVRLHEIARASLLYRSDSSSPLSSPSLAPEASPRRTPRTAGSSTPCWPRNAPARDPGATHPLDTSASNEVLAGSLACQ